MGSLKFPAHTKQLFQLVILDMSATRLTALVSLFICSFSVTSACQAVYLFGLLSITCQFLFALAQIRAGVLTKGGGKSGCQSSEGKRERQRSKTWRGGMGYLLSQNDASLCRRCNEQGVAVRLELWVLRVACSCRLRRCSRGGGLQSTAKQGDLSRTPRKILHCIPLEAIALPAQFGDLQRVAPLQLELLHTGHLQLRFSPLCLGGP